jgi:hypothetical protein
MRMFQGPEQDMFTYTEDRWISGRRTDVDDRHRQEAEVPLLLNWDITGQARG